MAFKYSDGVVYESDFEFWYIHGRKPAREEKTEIADDGPTSRNEGSSLTHPAHELSGRPRVRGKGRGPEWC